MSRLITALLEYQEYIILVLVPVVLGFAYFWLIHFSKHFIKVLNYTYGLVIPVIINLYFLYGVVQASLSNDFGATVTALAYFALSLSGTFTYGVMGIAVHSLTKKR